MKNFSLRKFLTHNNMNVDINILSDGMVMAKSTTNGYQVLNYKTVKPWTTGWPHEVDLIDFE